MVVGCVQLFEVAETGRRDENGFRLTAAVANWSVLLDGRAAFSDGRILNRAEIRCVLHWLDPFAAPYMRRVIKPAS